MQEFNFRRAETVDEVLERLASSRGKIELVAGGTDVMISLRNEELGRDIEEVLDISGIDELNFIYHKEDNGKEMLHIGAATPLRQIAADPLVKEKTLVLHKAADSVGSLQVRTRGTIGGNVVTAAQCADTVPALLVLEAVLVLKSKTGSREIAIEDFFTGPKQTDIREDELLTEIRIPVPPEGSRGVFDKLIRREAVAKSRLSVCVITKQGADKKVQDIRVCVGSCLGTHSRFPTVEKMVLGKIPNRELIEQAGAAAGDYIVEVGGYRWSTDYKKPVAASLTARALSGTLEVT